MLVLAHRNVRGAQAGIDRFVSGAGDAPDQLLRFQGAKKSATDVRKELEFAIAADQRPFALRRADVKTYARQEFAGRRGFGDVVVSAGCESLDLALLVIAVRQRDDG